MLWPLNRFFRDKAQRFNSRTLAGRVLNNIDHAIDSINKTNAPDVAVSLAVSDYDAESARGAFNVMQAGRPYIEQIPFRAEKYGDIFVFFMSGDPIGDFYMYPNPDDIIDHILSGVIQRHLNSYPAKPHPEWGFL